MYSTSVTIITLSAENQHWTPGQSDQIIQLENSENTRTTWDKFGLNALSQEGPVQLKPITAVSHSWGPAAASWAHRPCCVLGRGWSLSMGSWKVGSSVMSCSQLPSKKHWGQKYVWKPVPFNCISTLFKDSRACLHPLGVRSAEVDVQAPSLTHLRKNCCSFKARPWEKGDVLHNGVAAFLGKHELPSCKQRR